MEVYPALDLLDGACVRLRQGDFDRSTQFSRDPLAVARRFVREGARWLHVVDLEGAREGRPAHEELVLRLAGQAAVPVQAGGGLRSETDVARWLEGGVSRVLLGTTAAERPDRLERWIARWGPERLVPAVELRDGRVVTRGWRRELAMDRDALLGRLEAAGVRLLLYTDVLRDGTLSRPDTEGAAAVAARGFRVLVAGGIATAAHLRELAAAGAEGAVVGSALYRGRLTLREALEAAGAGEGETAC